MKFVWKGGCSLSALHADAKAMVINMTAYISQNRRRRVLRTRIAFFLLVLLLLGIFVFSFIELRLQPLIIDGAKSRARIFAAEVINDAVASALSDSAPLVNVSTGTDGIVGVQTDIAALSALRANAISAITERLESADAMTFSVPLGNLTGSTLIAGRGIPISVKLVPVGDITADVRTEFIESGINQTLHKIALRIRVTLNVLTAGEIVKLETATDVTLAETVIVGKVPDAYTAINRFEIDEDEENDLNDYAATLP